MPAVIRRPVKPMMVIRGGNRKSHQPAQAMTARLNTQPSAHLIEAAEEMDLLVAEELFREILEADEADVEAIARPDTRRDDDGGDGREDRKDQDHHDGGHDEEGAGVAVDPLAPRLS